MRFALATRTIQLWAMIFACFCTLRSAYSLYFGILQSFKSILNWPTNFGENQKIFRGQNEVKGNGENEIKFKKTIVLNPCSFEAHSSQLFTKTSANYIGI